MPLLVLFLPVQRSRRGFGMRSDGLMLPILQKLQLFFQLLHLIQHLIHWATGTTTVSSTEFLFATALSPVLTSKFTIVVVYCFLLGYALLLTPIVASHFL